MGTIYCNSRFHRRQWGTLLQCVQQARDGDVIAVGDKGVSPPEGVPVDKSITIEAEHGDKGRTAPIHAQPDTAGLEIDGTRRPVEVTLRHIDMTADAGANCIRAKGAVTLRLEDCTLGWARRTRDPRKTDDGDRYPLLLAERISLLDMDGCAIGGTASIVADRLAVKGGRIGRITSPPGVNGQQGLSVSAAQADISGGSWANAELTAAGSLRDVHAGGRLVLHGPLRITGLNEPEAETKEETQAREGEQPAGPWAVLAPRAGEAMAMEHSSLGADLPGLRPPLNIIADGSLTLSHCVLGAGPGPGMVAGGGSLAVSRVNDDAEWSLGGEGPSMEASDSHGGLAALAARRARAGRRKTGALDRINAMVGLAPVKRRLQGIVSTASVNRRMARAGRRVREPNLNALFLGQPGTGKTTVARLMAEALYDTGIIGRKDLVQRNVGDLKGTHVGEAARNMRDACDAALGGVLFLDEAYALGSDDVYTPDLVNVLIQYADMQHGYMVIVLAGYTEEMHRMMHANVGLDRRFPNKIDFPPYSPDELAVIGESMLAGDHYRLTEGARRALERHVRAVVPGLSHDPSFGNAGWMRNLMDEARTCHNLRVAPDGDVSGVPDDQLTLITEDDMRACFAGEGR